jgi:hypothetical protein
MDINLSQMFPSDDPLDKPDFNMTDWINQHFPNEESLGKIDEEMDHIKAMVKRLDEEIINEVSQHSKSGVKGQAALSDAQVSVTDLFEKIKDIKEKSLEADRMIKGIQEGIGDLDVARHNITITIKALGQLNNIIMKIEQIKQMIESRQYSDVAHSLESVNELLGKFNEYKNVPKIQQLHEEVQKIKVTLRTQLFNEFQREISNLTGQEKKNLASAAKVIDTLGIRADFIHDFSQQQLGYYDMEFVKRSEAAKLEHIDRRFTWLMTLLTSFHNNYSTIFPAAWKVDEVLAEDLCFRTREGVHAVMEASKSTLDPNVMKKALKKTVTFENEIGKIFAAKAGEDVEVYKKKI